MAGVVLAVMGLAELGLIMTGRNPPVPASSPLHRLTPFLADDGLLRVRGRLQMSDLSYEEKHPIIIPKGYLAELLVRERHRVMKPIAERDSEVYHDFWKFHQKYVAMAVKKGSLAVDYEAKR